MTIGACSAMGHREWAEISNCKFAIPVASYLKRRGRGERFEHEFPNAHSQSAQRHQTDKFHMSCEFGLTDFTPFDAAAG
jgi:hypothetical protein